MKFIEATRTSAEETVDEKGQTELHIAVLNNDIALVRELLSDDRDVNAQDNLQWTPLHIAANHGYWDIAQLLLQVPHLPSLLSPFSFLLFFDSTIPLYSPSLFPSWNIFPYIESLKI